jgi:HD superfamily phosphodiesterase
MQYKQEQILRSVNSIPKNKAAAGHDITHTLRVKDLCLYIAGIEGGDVENEQTYNTQLNSGYNYLGQG